MARAESSPENVAALLVASGGVDVSADEVAARVDATNDCEPGRSMVVILSSGTVQRGGDSLPLPVASGAAHAPAPVLCVRRSLRVHLPPRQGGRSHPTRRHHLAFGKLRHLRDDGGGGLQGGCRGGEQEG